MSKVNLPGRNLPQAGESIGRFRIERELARGGLGAVFVARDSRGEQVALKVLLDPKHGSGLERFRREAQLGMTLRHEGLCPVLQFGEHKGVAYLTMPLLEGALPITDYALARGLGARDVASLLLQAIDAMQAAHQSEAVHRDLKPGNVLVTPKGRVKIVDFGLGKQEGQNRLTETGQILGTVNYMAPEQVMGEGVRADARCDVFALGILLYELVTGELPFDDDTSVGVMRAILSRPTPDATETLEGDLSRLDLVIKIALAKDRDERYPTAKAFADDVRTVLAGRPLSKRARRGGRRTPSARLAAAGAVALLLCGAGVVGWTLRTRAESFDPIEVVQRAEALSAQTGRRLRSRRSLVAHPPKDAWRTELEELERAAGPDVPQALALAQAHDAALAGLTALARGDRVGAQAALARSRDAQQAFARSRASDAGEAEISWRALAGAVAAVTTQADPGQAAHDLTTAIQGGLRVPELRSWRAQAHVRAGLATREITAEAKSDLLAMQRLRPLTPDERKSLGEIYLHTWDVKRATQVLSMVSALPDRLAHGLTLARVQLALNHDDAAAACAHLGALAGPIAGYAARRESIRGAAVRRALAYLPALKRRSLSEQNTQRLNDELTLARAVCPGVSLPQTLLVPLVAAANDARGLDATLGAALADLAPEDYTTQRTVGILGLQRRGTREEQARLLEATRRALKMSPPEGRETLIVTLVQSLYYLDEKEKVLAEAERYLPEIADPEARLAVFAETTASAIALRRYDEALNTIGLALEIAPGHAKFRFYRAKVRWKQGRPEDGYEDALSFATSGFETGGANHALALAWLWDFGFSKAKRRPVRLAIESFLRGSPRDPGGWGVRAAALLLATGHVKKAAATLRTAAETLRHHKKADVRKLAAPSARAADSVERHGAGAQAEVDALTEELDRIRGVHTRP